MRKVIKATRKTAKRYKKLSKSLKDEDFYINGEFTLKPITGFGKKANCIICKAVEAKCDDCIFSSFSNANRFGGYCLYTPYYEEVDSARNIKELKTYLNKRADWLLKYCNVIERRLKDGKV